MRHPEFDTQELITNLQGTCMTLEAGIQQSYPEMTEDDLTEDDHEAIDNELFVCDTCNWWCEVSERGAEPQCEGDDPDDVCYGDTCTDCVDL